MGAHNWNKKPSKKAERNQWYTKPARHCKAKSGVKACSHRATKDRGWLTARERLAHRWRPFAHGDGGYIRCTCGKGVARIPPAPLDPPPAAAVGDEQPLPDHLERPTSRVPGRLPMPGCAVLKPGHIPERVVNAALNVVRRERKDEQMQRQEGSGGHVRRRALSS
jgi:hypothetical protein